MSPGVETKTILLAPGEPSREAVERSARAIASGGVIVYPTDTIYGLGCDATNRDAVRRVYEIKRRPETMPMIVLVGSIKEAAGLAEGVPALAEELMRACWPGPLTVLLRANASLYPWLSAGSGKIGVRFPKHAFCARLMEASKRPLLSTSANLSGQAYVSDVEALRDLFETQVDLFVDAGALPGSMPSTIVDGSAEVPVLVREGAVPGASLKRFLA